MASNIAQRAAANLEQSNNATTPREILKSMTKEFQRAMPSGADADQLVRDALTVLSSTPSLARLQDPNTFIAALMTCAQLGLRPGVGALGQAYIIPFKGKAQFILGYQGMIELANRSGEISSISAHAVHENDHFEMEYGIEDKLTHRPPLKEARGEIYGYYAVGKRTNGGYSFVYMSKAEAIQHRDKFALSPNGPWKNHFDAMALKTVIRKLFTFLPRSTDMQRAIVSDGTTRINLNPEAELDEVVEHDWAPEDPNEFPEGDADPTQVSGEYVG